MVIPDYYFEKFRVALSFRNVVNKFMLLNLYFRLLTVYILYIFINLFMDLLALNATFLTGLG